MIAGRVAESDPKCDVVIAGAGLAGLAACIFLRQAGLSVTCIEPEPFPHARLGESLDWSSPALLAVLGLPREQLIAERIATYKKNIQVANLGGACWTAEPPQWFGKWPLRFEVLTIHVDRAALDQRLFEKAQELGCQFVWDRVSQVEIERDRVVACRTAAGRSFTAPWFLDNSGQARVFGRAFHIPKTEYGRPKVCLWTYFKTVPRNPGTIFYVDATRDEYLTWTWEIPITPEVVSIGCVMPAAKLKEHRRNGEPVKKILDAEFARYEPLAELATTQPDFEVAATSYHSYVSRSACGVNWLMIGEAASFPDPLTASGVTAGFRHAQESARLIQQHLAEGSLPTREQHLYNTRVRRMGHFFNHSIETSIYEEGVRKGLSPMVAQLVYTLFAYPMNAIYARLHPRGRAKTIFLGFLLNVAWLWMEGWALAGRLASRDHSFLQGRPWCAASVKTAESGHEI